MLAIALATVLASTGSETSAVTARGAALDAGGAFEPRLHRFLGGAVGAGAVGSTGGPGAGVSFELGVRAAERLALYGRATGLTYLLGGAVLTSLLVEATPFAPISFASGIGVQSGFALRLNSGLFSRRGTTTSSETALAIPFLLSIDTNSGPKDGRGRLRVGLEGALVLGGGSWFGLTVGYAYR